VPIGPPVAPRGRDVGSFLLVGQHAFF
jgi:hypothetical protein